MDVNVHPTKREVGFLHQQALIEQLQAAVEAKLLASNDKWAPFPPLPPPPLTLPPSTRPGTCVPASIHQCLHPLL